MLTFNIKIGIFFRDWKISPIRSIRWHPNVFKLAIASIDDNIKIYSADTVAIITLKNGYQKCITSLAWRPLCAGELAVGCNNGIIIWKLDSPGRHTSQFLHLTRQDHVKLKEDLYTPHISLF